MADITKNIIVRTIYEESGLKNFANQLKQPVASTSNLHEMSQRLGVSTKELTKNFAAQGISMKGAALAGSGFFGVISKALPIVGAVASGIFQVGKFVWNLGKGIYNAIKGLARFRGEWLSVLFIAMMISTALTGMINEVLKITGVFEVFRMTIIALLLPVMMPLIQMLFKLVKWFIELPENIKKFIGTLILVAAAFAQILFVGSQFMILFNTLGISIGTIAVLLIPFAAALFAAAVGIKIFGDNAEMMADKLKNMIELGVDKAQEFITKFGDAFIANKDRILEIAHTIVSTILQGIIDILTTADKYVYTFIDTLAELFNRNFQEIGKIAQIIINWLIYFFATFAPSIVQLALTLIENLITGIEKNKDKLGEAASKIINMIATFISNNAGKFVDAFLGLVDKLKEAFGSEENRPKIEEAVNKLVNALTDAITKATPLILSLGWKIGGAIINGITSALAPSIMEGIINKFLPSGLKFNFPSGSGGTSGGTEDYSTMMSYNIFDV